MELNAIIGVVGKELHALGWPSFQSEFSELFRGSSSQNSFLPGIYFSFRSNIKVNHIEFERLGAKILSVCRNVSTADSTNHVPVGSLKCFCFCKYWHKSAAKLHSVEIFHLNLKLNIFGAIFFTSFGFW